MSAMPAMPTPLFVFAAAMPATCVPWSLSSSEFPFAQVPVLPTQFAPVRTRPLRSGWLAWTPVSTTAMVGPASVVG